MQRVLLAVDGSENSLKAARHVVEMVRVNPCLEVTIVTVVPRAEDLKGISPWVTSSQVENSTEDYARAIVDKARELFEREGFKVNWVIRKGSPAKAIADYAKLCSFDHVVVGSRGLNKLEGIILGSVSQKLIYLAHCTITLVK